MEFDSYAFVVLQRQPDAAEISDEEADEIQEMHLAHLAAMKAAGKLLVAGPFGDRPDESWRGLRIYGTSVEEARELAERDPAVQRGRFKPVVMTWFVQKGAIAFPVAN